MEWKRVEGLELGQVGEVDMAEKLEGLRKRHADTPTDPETRLRLARTRNAILLLAQWGAVISPLSLTRVYESSLRHCAHPKVAQLTSHTTYCTT